jgi:Ser/Thr protein kinase RdoA (MazF antagonist)
MPLLSAENRLEVANRALEAYEIQPIAVFFLQHSENLTFRVRASQGDFLLRVHSPVTRAFGDYGMDRAVVNSEMAWLAALNEAGLSVPPPVQTHLGEFTTQVDGLNVTLLKWLDGELLTREMESDETAAQIGSLVGKLHKQSALWQLPDGFTRPSRDAAYFENAVMSLWPAVEDGRIDAWSYRTLQASIAWLTGEICRVNPTRQTYGLIHGDLHRGNFLIHNEQISLIDFSMSAFGYYAYDLGTCLSNIRSTFHRTFLENYAQYFSLPDGYERLIEAYFIGSWVAAFSLWISDADSQETLVQRVPLIANKYAERFNRDERFWFNE